MFNPQRFSILGVTMRLAVLSLIIFMWGCAQKSSLYEMPSVESSEAPEWVEQMDSLHDSTYVIIFVNSDGSDLQKAGQSAMSLLHQRISLGLPILLDSYFDARMPTLTDEERFSYYAQLPAITEQIMSATEIRDGWVADEGLAILCAVDIEEAGNVLVNALELPSRSFVPHLKRNILVLTRESELP